MIATEQVRQTGDILGIAVVERLDRIIELLERAALPKSVHMLHAALKAGAETTTDDAEERA